ncbi:MAG: hypothetical protein Q7V05_09345 [Methanoregula sp.]|nr:hypothetical protein [Methanoregula sp.]
MANYNAGRIWELYGTVTKKGDHTPERPHRRSRIISVPERLEVVKTELLEKLGTALPADSYFTAASPVEIKGYKNIVKLLDWLFRHNISVKSEKSCHNGRFISSNRVPFPPTTRTGRMRSSSPTVRSMRGGK